MKKIIPLTLAILSLTMTNYASATTKVANQSSNSGKPSLITSGFNPDINAKDYAELCSSLIESAKTMFIQLENDTSKATLSSVFGQFDEISFSMQDVRHSWYLKAVHPDEDLRKAAADCTVKYSDLFSGFSMSKKFYQRVAAIDTTALSKVEKFMVENALEDFKQAGVDKDEATRNKIRALNKEISEIGNLFSKNINEDTRYVETDAEGLYGLPEDYIDAKKKDIDASGKIKISTNYPDMGPVLKYAENDELRKNIRIASRSRGFPQNDPVLKNLIEKRHELATLLGYKNWASMSMKRKMIANPENAQNFLAKIGAALKEPVKAEIKAKLARLQKLDPSTKEVNAWQDSYLNNLMVKEEYALDSKEVREYFSYSKVRDGIFKLTEDLFGVQIKPWKTKVWHDDVESYEVRENGQLLGRFYMDNHPRDNKYKHAAHWTLRTGIKSKQIPMSALAQNFPKGLMEHGQVETFLHEFGHLLHNMFSGNHPWLAIAGMSMERDFVEAPSQMLEEWIWDYDTLKSFAVNHEGKVIPKLLVDKMVRARDFGKAIATATQIFYANLSLNYYSQDPKQLDLMSVLRDISDTYNPYPFVEGTAFYANFGHLYGYSSDYYTYQWSLAIATDLFSRFKEKGMRNKQVSKEYRAKILGVGGSKPATEFVEDFLGRKLSIDAYINSLKQ
ncbi:MAG: Zn-dependent oligopeptidase [Gammaproteobacteria bacterium]|nr:Zn-dependent oligopeptidase [Gammaproteobacteria bacterium]